MRTHRGRMAHDLQYELWPPATLREHVCACLPALRRHAPPGLLLVAVYLAGHALSALL